SADRSEAVSSPRSAAGTHPPTVPPFAPASPCPSHPSPSSRASDGPRPVRSPRPARRMRSSGSPPTRPTTTSWNTALWIVVAVLLALGVGSRLVPLLGDELRLLRQY